jgi:CubicO group peptidase (beta-lactamase class C family)
MSRLSRWHQDMSVGLSLLLVLVLLLSACDIANHEASGQEPSLTSRLDAFFTTEVKEKVFSGSVLIVKGGKVLLRKGYSMADWRHQLPNTPTTKFHIASLTKAFTAMAILILQERGKLHVQDHICLYVSACPIPWQPITIQQLLTHTSGMTADLSSTDLIPLQGVPSSPQRNLLVLEKKGLDYPPGTQFSYSNVGYMLLGYLIEKVAQEPFALFLQKNILNPLHMTNTGFTQKDSDVANLATGYSQWQSPIAYEPYLSIGFAAGGLYSTVDDLSRWDQALYTQQLVSQKSLDAMFTPYVSVCPEFCPPSFSFSKQGYGYGWFIGKEAPSARRVIWAPGVVDGFHAYLMRYLDDKVSIIVLSNLETLDPNLIPKVQKIVFATSS